MKLQNENERLAKRGVSATQMVEMQKEHNEKLDDVD